MRKSYLITGILGCCLATTVLTAQETVKPQEKPTPETAKPAEAPQPATAQPSSEASSGGATPANTGTGTSSPNGNNCVTRATRLGNVPCSTPVVPADPPPPALPVVTSAPPAPAAPTPAEMKQADNLYQKALHME